MPPKVKGKEVCRRRRRRASVAPYQGGVFMALRGDHSFGAIGRGAGGLTTACISKIFHGQNRPSYDTASRISSFLGVSLGEFFDAYDREFGPKRDLYT